MELNEWCLKFEAACNNELKPEVSEFLYLLVLEDCKDGTTLDITDCVISRIIKHRADVLELILSKSLIEFLTGICETPAHVSMYLAFIKHKTNFCDLRKFSTTICPMGLPTKEQLDELWDMQKLGSRNLLDQ